MTSTIHISDISRCAAPDYRVWRAFDHLIAQGAGLLLVPVGLADGDLTGVVDRCPVPWHEVWAALDTPPANPQPVSPERLRRIAPAVALHLDPFGWVRDVVPAAGSTPTLARLTGPQGVRYVLLGGEG